MSHTQNASDSKNKKEKKEKIVASWGVEQTTQNGPKITNTKKFTFFTVQILLVFTPIFFTLIFLLFFDTNLFHADIFYFFLHHFLHQKFYFFYTYFLRFKGRFPS